MYFLFFKVTHIQAGQIMQPVKGEPDIASVSKESNCSLGRGVHWENVDLFYAPDEEFPEDFQKWAATGKYYVENDKAEENLDWVEPEEEE